MTLELQEGLVCAVNNHGPTTTTSKYGKIANGHTMTGLTVLTI